MAAIQSSDKIGSVSVDVIANLEPFNQAIEHAVQALAERQLAVPVSAQGAPTGSQPAPRKGTTKAQGQPVTAATQGAPVNLQFDSTQLAKTMRSALESALRDEFEITLKIANLDELKRQLGDFSVQTTHQASPTVVHQQAAVQQAAMPAQVMEAISNLGGGGVGAVDDLYQMFKPMLNSANTTAEKIHSIMVAFGPSLKTAIATNEKGAVTGGTIMPAINAISDPTLRGNAKLAAAAYAKLVGRAGVYSAFDSAGVPPTPTPQPQTVFTPSELAKPQLHGTVDQYAGTVDMAALEAQRRELSAAKEPNAAVLLANATARFNEYKRREAHTLAGGRLTPEHPYDPDAMSVAEAEMTAYQRAVDMQKSSAAPATEKPPAALKKMQLFRMESQLKSGKTASGERVEANIPGLLEWLSNAYGGGAANLSPLTRPEQFELGARSEGKNSKAGIGRLGYKGIDVSMVARAAQAGDLMHWVERMEGRQRTGEYGKLEPDVYGNLPLLPGQRGAIPGTQGEFEALKDTEVAKRFMLALGVPEDQAAATLARAKANTGGQTGLLVPFLAKGRRLALPTKPGFSGRGGGLRPVMSAGGAGLGQGGADLVETAASRAEGEANRRRIEHENALNVGGWAGLGAQGSKIPASTENEIASAVKAWRQQNEMTPQLGPLMDEIVGLFGQHQMGTLPVPGRLFEPYNSGIQDPSQFSTAKQLHEALADVLGREGGVYDVLGLKGRNRRVTALSRYPETEPIAAAVSAVKGLAATARTVAAEDANRKGNDQRVTGYTERDIRYAQQWPGLTELDMVDKRLAEIGGRIGQVINDPLARGLAGRGGHIVGGRGVEDSFIGPRRIEDYDFVGPVRTEGSGAFERLGVLQEKGPKGEHRTVLPPVQGELQLIEERAKLQAAKELDLWAPGQEPNKPRKAADDPRIKARADAIMAANPRVAALNAEKAQLKQRRDELLAQQAAFVPAWSQGLRDLPAGSSRERLISGDEMGLAAERGSGYVAPGQGGLLARLAQTTPGGKIKAGMEAESQALNRAVEEERGGWQPHPAEVERAIDNALGGGGGQGGGQTAFHGEQRVIVVGQFPLPVRLVNGDVLGAGDNTHRVLANMRADMSESGLDGGYSRIAQQMKDQGFTAKDFRNYMREKGRGALAEKIEKEVFGGIPGGTTGAPGGGGGGGGGTPDEKPGRIPSRGRVYVNPQGLAEEGNYPTPGFNSLAQEKMANERLKRERAERKAAESKEQARVQKDAQAQARLLARGIRPTPGAVLGSLSSSGLFSQEQLAEFATPIQPQRPNIEEDTQFGAAVIRARQRAAAQRAALPSRALSTSIVQLAERFLGGRSAPEQRILELQRETGELSRLENQGRGIASARTAARDTLLQRQRFAREFTTRGQVIPTELRREIDINRESYVRHTKALQDNAKAVVNQAEKIEQFTAVTGKDIVRNLAAGFAGGVAGALVTGGVGAVASTIVPVISELFRPAEDAISGYAKASNEVISSLADQTRANHGLVAQTVAASAANAGLAYSTYKTIAPRLEESAAIEAGNKAWRDQLDMLRAAQQGPQRGVFSTAGGFVLPGGIETPIGGTPNTIENVFDMFNGVHGRRTGFAVDPMTDFGMMLKNLTDGGQEDAKSLKLTTDGLNFLQAQLDKTGKGFRVVNDNVEAANNMYAAMEAAGVGGRALLREQDLGLGFADKTGKPIPADQIGDLLTTLTQAVGKLDVKTFLEQNQLPFQQQMFQIERGGILSRAQLGAQTALSRLGQPLIPLGAQVPGGAPAAFSGGYQFNAGDYSVEENINHRQQSNRAQLMNLLSNQGLSQADQAAAQGLVGELDTIGQKLQGLQVQRSQIAFDQIFRGFNHDSEVAARNLGDLYGMAQKLGLSFTKTKDVQTQQVGLLEGENMMLSRQMQLRNFDLAQKQLNYQIALAGFTAEGSTGEERAQRMRIAKLQTDVQQKNLTDTQTIAGNEFDIQKENVLRGIKDSTFAYDDLIKRMDELGQTTAIDEKITHLQAASSETSAAIQTYLDQGVAFRQSVDSLAADLVGLGQDAATAIQTATDQMNTAAMNLKTARDTLVGTVTPPGTGEPDYGQRVLNGTSTPTGATYNIQITGSATDAHAIAVAVEKIINQKSGLLGTRVV